MPASTGAAKAIGLVIPELQGKLHGFAVRAPVPTGSVVDLTVAVARARRRDEEINEAFKRARPTPARCNGHPPYTEDPIVSIGHRQVAVLVDLRLPADAVIDGTLVKVVAWYDNEWGYSNRCVELAQKVLVRAHA